MDEAKLAKNGFQIYPKKNCTSVDQQTTVARGIFPSLTRLRILVALVPRRVFYLLPADFVEQFLDSLTKFQYADSSPSPIYGNGVFRLFFP